MTITPPQLPAPAVLYRVLSTSNVPDCEREEHPFGFHDSWPTDMEPDEFILIEINDGSSRIASNEAGHVMLIGQLYRIAQDRGELVVFRRFRCRPRAAA